MQNSEQTFQIGNIRPVECFKEGWEIIKGEYWLFFAITLVGVLIGGVSLYILLGAMVAGIYLCYLKKIDGQTATLEDLWKGFSYFKPSLVVTIFIIVPVIVVYVGLYGQILAAAFFGQNISNEQMTTIIGGSLLIDFVFIVLMVCFHTLILFSYLLIVDRGLSGIRSMRTSASAVWKNLSGVAGLLGVGFLLSLAGMLVCGIGVYFVIPVLMAGYTVAYRKIFPRLHQNFEPPSPDIYRNL